MGAKARGIAGLAVGTMAPTFVLDDQDGTPVSLAEQRGRWVVLYFYPADDTPACTTQACDLRDSWEALRAAGAVVLGVSPDDAATHRAFRARYRLPFPLLVDEGHRVAERYGAWGEKQLYGRTYIGLIRTTVIIDPAGRIAQFFPRTRAAGHAGRIRAALERLQAA